MDVAVPPQAKWLFPSLIFLISEENAFCLFVLFFFQACEHQQIEPSIRRGLYGFTDEFSVTFLNCKRKKSRYADKHCYRELEQSWLGGDWCNTFIQQGWIKLIRCNHRDLYLLLQKKKKIINVLLNFLFIKYSVLFNIDKKNNFLKHQIWILEWFLKDHVTLKNGV